MPSRNATLLMEENAIMEHNYSVSHSAITLMVFNIEHIQKLNGMGTPPNRTTRLLRTCSLHPAVSAFCLMGNTLSPPSSFLNTLSHHPAHSFHFQGYRHPSSFFFLVSYCSAMHSSYKLPTGLTTSRDALWVTVCTASQKTIAKSIVTRLLSPNTAAQF